MTGRPVFRLAAALAALLAAGGVMAAETGIGELVVKDAWARATMGHGKAGAVYLSIFNHGDEADRLVAAETPVAERARLHTHTMDGDVMKMRPVAGIEIAGDGTAVLEPGAGHVMLMGLNGPLEEGASFTLTLVFERAGRVEVPVAVMSATAMRHGGHGAHKR